MRAMLFRGIRWAVLVLAGIAAVGAVVMALWNGLIPVLFGGPVLGFWQALGLWMLSRLLVGGLRGGRGRGAAWRARQADLWATLSDDERAAWREQRRGRCGGPRPPATPA